MAGARYLGVWIGRGAELDCTQLAQEKLRSRAESVAALGFGAPHGIHLHTIVGTSCVRHSLSCALPTSELRHLWSQSFARHFSASQALGNTQFWAKELHSWPASVPHVDVVWLQSSLLALRRLEGDPRDVLLDLQSRTSVAGANYPLSGWLNQGAWASWARAAQLLEEQRLLDVSHVTPSGITLRLAQNTTACRLRELVVGTSRSALHALVQRVGTRWHQPDTWGLRAVLAIRIVARTAGPACSAAYAKLLNFLLRMPLRGTTRSCVWCGSLHFSDEVPAILSV
eukprot:6485513-Amphidinium_carterae.1